MEPHAKVIFLQIYDSASKLQHLCEIVQRAFNKKESILIIAPSENAACYVDELLWRQPKDSFIPHIIAEAPTVCLTVITTTENNYNKASILLNLCTDCPKFFNTFPTIYDFLDCTNLEKETQAKMRMKTYEHSHYKIQMPLNSKKSHEF